MLLNNLKGVRDNPGQYMVRNEVLAYLLRRIRIAFHMLVSLVCSSESHPSPNEKTNGDCKFKFFWCIDLILCWLTKYWSIFCLFKCLMKTWFVPDKPCVLSFVSREIMICRKITVVRFNIIALIFCRVFWIATGDWPHQLHSAYS